MIDYGKFPIGRVVMPKDKRTYFDKYAGDVGDYVPWRPHVVGHVVGFTFTEYDNCVEPILIVKWADGEEQKIHPSNVIPL